MGTFLDEWVIIEPRLALVRGEWWLYPWQWDAGGGVHQRSPLGSAADRGVHGCCWYEIAR
ncbi:hypothetical protein OG266_38560 [Streptomyces sp. NBC_00554]|uniref:hypothetical protein n=1 Tax=Streptomyces sp. NBC_00554 TaxID=2903661 RepID=UPI00352D2AC7|nr:hypothetical protein OG266_38560 [Streptomyces sp. NBC_00554]